jgi:hypothetical protein
MNGASHSRPLVGLAARGTAAVLLDSTAHTHSNIAFPHEQSRCGCCTQVAGSTTDRSVRHHTDGGCVRDHAGAIATTPILFVSEPVMGCVDDTPPTYQLTRAHRICTQQFSKLDSMGVLKYTTIPCHRLARGCPFRPVSNG